MKYNGIIPSVEEVFQNPYCIDLKDFYFEMQFQAETASNRSIWYPSKVFVFGSDDAPYFCVIKKGGEGRALGKDYGWLGGDKLNRKKENIAEFFSIWDSDGKQHKCDWIRNKYYMPIQRW